MQTNNPAQFRKFLSINETCLATSLGRTTVYDLVNKGVIKSIKVGKRRLIDAQSVDALSQPLEEAA